MSKSFQDYFDTPDTTTMYDTYDIQENKVWAILSYLPVLFILPLFVNGGQSKFAKYHANQGFILFLLDIACMLVSALLGWIPVLGTIVKTILGIVVLAMMVFGMIHAACGMAKELPFIGGLMHVFDK